MARLTRFMASAVCVFLMFALFTRFHDHVPRSPYVPVTTASDSSIPDEELFHTMVSGELYQRYPFHSVDDTKLDQHQPLQGSAALAGDDDYEDDEDDDDDDEASASKSIPSSARFSSTIADMISDAINDEHDLVESPSGVDWSRFAYTQYITNHDYLCNTVMLFETLHRLGSRAERAMMYPSWMLPDPAAGASETDSGWLLIKARDQYEARLVPIEVQHRETMQESWADSYTKLLAFNQTQYDRVLSLDSDSLLLQPMDELFLMPPSPMAMPRAYWLTNDDPPKRILSSQVMLLQPSTAEFARVADKIATAGWDDYDMDIVNDLYYDSAMVLPHRGYDMLTSEFRSTAHTAYLGSDREAWEPVAELQRAKFVHFSDWPVPKPWMVSDELDEKRKIHQPECETFDGVQDCTQREIWNGFYDTFLERREKICSISVGPDGIKS